MKEIDISIKPTVHANSINVANRLPQDSHWTSTHDAIKYYSLPYVPRLRELLSMDYVLAKLTDQEKEFVINQVKVAILTKRILNEFASEYPGVVPDETDYGQLAFDTIMSQVQMMVTMNRNVPDNHLMKLLTRVQQEVDAEIEQDTKQPKGVMNKIASSFQKKNDQDAQAQ